MTTATSVTELMDWVQDARQRTLALVSDLDDRQLMGPRLSIVNPLLWEIGHVAWFQEFWVLRHCAGRPPLRADGDRLYDSAKVAHDTRWDLPLPSRPETLQYMRDVNDRVQDLVSQATLPDLEYFVKLSVFHEDMHDEAIAYTRQTHGYAAPALGDAPEAETTSAATGDAEIPHGFFLMGADRTQPFVFDNEKWAHEVKVEPFAMSRTAVTQDQFRAFVEDGGYQRRECWSEAGWAWRTEAAADHPAYWSRQADGSFWQRRFDAVVSLDPDAAMVHVNWYEADAWCRWARRRLPTEAEWEFAAGPAGFPWGHEPPSPSHANLDGLRGGCTSVHALSQGDSPWGIRQMTGNVWEWTSDLFGPYPGFVVDPYKEYSEPWFGTHYVLRGGCWVTRSRLLRNTWRNFYTPDRRDVWAGFRTCALNA